MAGMPEGSPAWHFSMPVLALRLCGCSPLLELMSRYCSYLPTSAAQYWASIDCANATPGKPIATTASQVTMCMQAPGEAKSSVGDVTVA